MPLPLPKSRREIAETQRVRKRAAVERARRTPFWRERLAHVNVERLEDPAEWRKIPLLDKEQLRALPSAQFYREFCHLQHDGLSEYWRSGGSTGRPLFYPRSFTDIQFGLLSFKRTFDCAGIGPGERAHNSFPMGIHPAGQIFARCATAAGIAMNWAGAGNSTPSALQLELIRDLEPTIWVGMSGYGLHLANLADSLGIDLAARSVKTIVCTAEPLSAAKRAKLERAWGARVFDTFGMTEAGMMGGEDGHDPGSGFRIWTDLYFIEVLHPETHAPVGEGEEGLLVVTPLWTNNITPFLRWSSGDLVVYREADDARGPFSVFPLVRHAHRTAGFFKVSGVNINHSEFEDFMFAIDGVNDFKCEIVASDALDRFVVSVEFARAADAAATHTRLSTAVREIFELTPEVVQLPAGTLAREFEAAVKTPRFLDKR